MPDDIRIISLYAKNAGRWMIRRLYESIIPYRASQGYPPYALAPMRVAPAHARPHPPL